MSIPFCSLLFFFYLSASEKCIMLSKLLCQQAQLSLKVWFITINLNQAKFSDRFAPLETDTLACLLSDMAASHP